MSENNNGHYTGETDRWETEEELIEWINDFCDYVVSSYRDSAAKYPDGSDLAKAQKARGIQNDIKSGEISFEEALERYHRELRTGTDQNDGEKQ